MALNSTLAIYYILPGFAAYLVTSVGAHLLIPRLIRSGIVGQDVHKPDRREVAEMGGIAIFAGIVAGISTAIAISTFGDPADFGRLYFVRIPLVTAAFATIGIIAVIGIADDMVTMRQRTKALLPAFASLPLVAIAAGDPFVFIPGWGVADIGYAYPLVVVPLAVTGAANATNMLAGWNGLEAGLGATMFGTLSIYGAANENTTLLAISIPCLLACVAFISFNWHPARLFPGDVGTFTIGGAFAACVIVGNVEFLGLFLMVPFVIDFAMKARHRFPKTFAEVDGEKLVCPRGEPPKGLGQLFLHIGGGMSEPALVRSLVAFEAVFGALGLLVLHWFGSL